MNLKTQKKHFISLVIVFIISLQILVTFRIPGYIVKVVPSVKKYVKPEYYYAPNMWPFLTYTMYDNANYKGDKIKKYSIYAIVEDSSKIKIEPDDVSMNFWQFRDNIIRPVKNHREIDIQRYRTIIRKKLGDKSVNLRIKSYSWILCRSGLEKDSTRTVGTITVKK